MESMHGIDAAMLVSASGRGLLLAGLLLLTGALAASALSDAAREADGGAAALQRIVGRSLPRTALTATAPWLLVAGAVLMLAGQLVALEVFAEDGMPLGATLRALLLGTGWGTAWSAFLLFGVLLAVTRAPHALTQALVPLLLGTLPFLGHGGAAFGEAPLVYWATVLHVVMAAAWLGTLAHAAPGWWRGAPTVSLDRYRRLARVAAPIALAAGAYLAWHRIGGLAGLPVSLLSSTWGRLLAAKGGLALATLALGAWHHRRLAAAVAAAYDAPVERSLAGTRRDTMRATLVAELVLAVAIVACTAWLAQSEPPT